MDQAAFDDNMERVQTVDFSWKEVAEHFNEDIEDTEQTLVQQPLTQDEIDRIRIVLEMLLKWAWQGKLRKTNVNGLQIRTIILCWQILPELHHLTLSDMAKLFGKDKLSFGRWTSKFRKRFPWIRSPHFARR